MTQPTFKNPDDAFEDAISAGRLSRVASEYLFAGNWMYMGTWDGIDAFKNINTREYLDDKHTSLTRTLDKLV